MKRWTLASGLLGLALAVDSGCTVDELPRGAAGSAGAVDAGGDGQAGAGGDGSVGCSELYVSAEGDDASSGCEPNEAKRTIAAALDVARAGGSVTAIHVCAGSYDEALTLDLPVDLLGGYSCSSWTRTPSYGYPSFDAANETLIGGSQVPQALRITGAAVDASTMVDGLTVVGSSAANAMDAAAVRVDGSAAPIVTNCRIRGGATLSLTDTGSVGLRVDSGAQPEIRANQIDGGSGTTFAPTGVGRAGIYVDAAQPSIHDNTVTGGSSPPKLSYGISSVGIVLRDATPLTEAAGRPLRNNTISGGDGNGNTDMIASAGVLLLGATDVDIVESSIRPGGCVGSAVLLRGVESKTSGELRILRSRIYGGDLSKPADASLGFRVGVVVDGAKSLLVENNMVYGGVPIDGFKGGSPSFALALANVPAPVLRHNTLYSGPSGYPTLGTNLYLSINVIGAVVQNNILAGGAGWTEHFYVEPCASFGVFERIENNLLFNTGVSGNGVIGQLWGYGPSPQGPEGLCGGWQGFSQIDLLTSHLLAACTSSTPGPCLGFGGIKVSGNRALKANCGTDSGCISWPACDATSLTCLQSVFEGWSADQNGLDTLFGPGWKLAPGVPCAVAKSSLDLGLAADSFGFARTAPPSIGAHEYDGACTP